MSNKLIPKLMDYQERVLRGLVNDLEARVVSVCMGQAAEEILQLRKIVRRFESDPSGGEWTTLMQEAYDRAQDDEELTVTY